MIDLKAIRAAAEAATKGEWIEMEGCRFDPEVVITTKHRDDRNMHHVCGLEVSFSGEIGIEQKANAKHIATANPATVIALLDRLEAAEKALAEPAQTTCNCRWEGDTQVQECTLHQAHKDAINEWAERAKTAEKKLAEPAVEPVDIEELAHSALQEALSYGLGLDLFVRYFKTVQKASPPPPAEVPLLTTDEYTTLAHRIASKYTHRSDPQHIAYTFLPHTLEQFARSIERAVRQKAGLV